MNEEGILLLSTVIGAAALAYAVSVAHWVSWGVLQVIGTAPALTGAV